MSCVVNKIASKMEKQAGIPDEIKAWLSDPENQKLLATYAVPTAAGAGIGALVDKKPARGGILGLLAGLGIGGGLHAAQKYNVGGFGDWAKNKFNPSWPTREGQKAIEEAAEADNKGAVNYSSDMSGAPTEADVKRNALIRAQELRAQADAIESQWTKLPNRAENAHMLDIGKAKRDRASAIEATIGK